MNAVRRTSPDVAVFVNTETICIARFDFVKNFTSGQVSAGSMSNMRMYCLGSSVV